jgi:hypothetical protein
MVQAFGLKCLAQGDVYGRPAHRLPRSEGVALGYDGSSLRPRSASLGARPFAAQGFFSPKGWSIVAEGNALGRSG